MGVRAHLPGPEDNFLHCLPVRRGGFYVDRPHMLLTSNQITVKSGHEISHFSPPVVANLVNFAAGDSTTIKQVAESLFGPQVLDAVHNLGGWDSGYELAVVWRPTAQGDLFTVRFYSHFLALQIMAREIEFFRFPG
ncbi:hypothetical protein F4604DRAFT_1678892 [Suillus subluteus]|nr:hypothetical protein F4604DRAFT_1678892 [Suillus subluteus]